MTFRYGMEGAIILLVSLFGTKYTKINRYVICWMIQKGS